MPVTQEQFNQMALNCPKDKLQPYCNHFVEACKEFEINTPNRIAAFMAQIIHESGSFRYMEEVASGEDYDIKKNPKLARTLGNVNEGDGKKFKGRGVIQLTGRFNYRKAGNTLGLPLEAQPELAALPENAFRIAGWFWKTNGLNELADKQDFVTITKRINGGVNHLADRLKHWGRCKKVLGL